MRYIDTFEVTSGQVVVTDPCYNLALGASIILANVRNGTWSAWIDTIDGEPSSLIIQHDNYQCSVETMLEDNIGVDSGQIGIFDFNHYPEGETGEYDDPTSFYRKVCDLSLGDDGAGIIDNFGVNSSTAHGDGSYRCHVGYDNNGQVAYIRAELAWQEEPEDEDWFDEEQDEE